MPLHRDFLMRSIERLAAAFGRMIAGAKSDTPQDQQREIEQLVAEVLDVRQEFVLTVGPSVIDTTESALAAQVARLMFLHARLGQEAGDGRVGSSTSFALSAARRALDVGRTEHAGLAADQLREHADLVQRLLGAEALAAAWWDAFEANRRASAYADAEDALFFALDIGANPERVRAAEAFYERLSAATDVDLESGGLSRDEIAESRAQLDDYR